MKQYRKMTSIETKKIKTEQPNKYKRTNSTQNIKSQNSQNKENLNELITCMKNLLTIGINNPLSFINPENINEDKIENKDLYQLYMLYFSYKLLVANIQNYKLQDSVKVIFKFYCLLSQYIVIWDNSNKYII